MSGSSENVNSSARVIEPSSGEWPACLSNLGPHTVPARLFALGLPLSVGEGAIAIVGSRRPTVAGLEAADLLGRGLAEAGFPIVSGLALGIDSTAHRAALAVGGYTIGVAGCGLDVDYPRRNRRLREDIATKGTLVSEYEPGTSPEPHHFPERNRIIVGLARAVIFVEGSLTSGGLITARIGLDADRTVFAVPGSFRNVMASGPNELIRTSNAALVTEVRHVLEDLAPQMAWDGPPSLGIKTAPVTLDELEKNIVSALDDVPLTADELCARLGLTFGAVSLGLAKLEVRGLAVRRSMGYEVTNFGARVRRAMALSGASSNTLVP